MASRDITSKHYSNIQERSTSLSKCDKKDISEFIQDSINSIKSSNKKEVKKSSIDTVLNRMIIGDISYERNAQIKDSPDRTHSPFRERIARGIVENNILDLFEAPISKDVLLAVYKDNRQNRAKSTEGLKKSPIGRKIKYKEKIARLIFEKLRNLISDRQRHFFSRLIMKHQVEEMKKTIQSAIMSRDTSFDNRMRLSKAQSMANLGNMQGFDNISEIKKIANSLRGSNIYSPFEMGSEIGNGLGIDDLRFSQTTSPSNMTPATSARKRRDLKLNELEEHPMNSKRDLDTPQFTSDFRSQYLQNRDSDNFSKRANIANDTRENEFEEQRIVTLGNQEQLNTNEDEIQDSETDQNIKANHVNIRLKNLHEKIKGNQVTQNTGTAYAEKNQVKLNVNDNKIKIMKPGTPEQTISSLSNVNDHTGDFGRAPPNTLTNINKRKESENMSEADSIQLISTRKIDNMQFILQSKLNEISRWAFAKLLNNTLRKVSNQIESTPTSKKNLRSSYPINLESPSSNFFSENDHNSYFVRDFKKESSINSVGISVVNEESRRSSIKETLFALINAEELLEKLLRKKYDLGFAAIKMYIPRKKLTSFLKNDFMTPKSKLKLERSNLSSSESTGNLERTPNKLDSVDRLIQNKIDDSIKRKIIPNFSPSSNSSPKQPYTVVDSVQKRKPDANGIVMKSTLRDIFKKLLRYGFDAIKKFKGRDSLDIQNSNFKSFGLSSKRDQDEKSSSSRKDNHSPMPAFHKIIEEHFDSSNNEDVKTRAKTPISMHNTSAVSSEKADDTNDNSKHDMIQARLKALEAKISFSRSHSRQNSLSQSNFPIVKAFEDTPRKNETIINSSQEAVSQSTSSKKEAPMKDRITNVESPKGKSPKNKSSPIHNFSEKSQVFSNSKQSKRLITFEASDAAEENVPVESYQESREIDMYEFEEVPQDKLPKDIGTFGRIQSYPEDEDETPENDSPSRKLNRYQSLVQSQNNEESPVRKPKRSSSLINNVRESKEVKTLSDVDEIPGELRLSMKQSLTDFPEAYSPKIKKELRSAKSLDNLDLKNSLRMSSIDPSVFRHSATLSAIDENNRASPEKLSYINKLSTGKFPSLIVDSQESPRDHPSKTELLQSRVKPEQPVIEESDEIMNESDIRRRDDLSNEMLDFNSSKSKSSRRQNERQDELEIGYSIKPETLNFKKKGKPETKQAYNEEKLNDSSKPKVPKINADRMKQPSEKSVYSNESSIKFDAQQFHFNEYESLNQSETIASNRIRQPNSPKKLPKVDKITNAALRIVAEQVKNATLRTKEDAFNTIKAFEGTSSEALILPTRQSDFPLRNSSPKAVRLTSEGNGTELTYSMSVSSPHHLISPKFYLSPSLNDPNNFKAFTEAPIEEENTQQPTKSESTSRKNSHIQSEDYGKQTPPKPTKIIFPDKKSDNGEEERGSAGSGTPPRNTRDNMGNLDLSPIEYMSYEGNETELFRGGHFGSARDDSLDRKSNVDRNRFSSNHDESEGVPMNKSRSSTLLRSSTNPKALNEYDSDKQKKSNFETKSCLRRSRTLEKNNFNNLGSDNEEINDLQKVIQEEKQDDNFEIPERSEESKSLQNNSSIHKLQKAESKALSSPSANLHLKDRLAFESAGNIILPSKSEESIETKRSLEILNKLNKDESLQNRHAIVPSIDDKNLQTRSDKDIQTEENEMIEEEKIEIQRPSVKDINSQNALIKMNTSESIQVDDSKQLNSSSRLKKSNSLDYQVNTDRLRPNSEKKERKKMRMSTYTIPNIEVRTEESSIKSPSNIVTPPSSKNMSARRFSSSSKASPSNASIRNDHKKFFGKPSPKNFKKSQSVVFDQLDALKPNKAESSPTAANLKTPEKPPIKTFNKSKTTISKEKDLQLELSQEDRKEEKSVSTPTSLLAKKVPTPMTKSMTKVSSIDIKNSVIGKNLAKSQPVYQSEESNPQFVRITHRSSFELKDPNIQSLISDPKSNLSSPESDRCKTDASPRKENNLIDSAYMKQVSKSVRSYQKFKEREVIENLLKSKGIDVSTIPRGSKDEISQNTSDLRNSSPTEIPKNRLSSNEKNEKIEAQDEDPIIENSITSKHESSKSKNGNVKETTKNKIEEDSSKIQANPLKDEKNIEIINSHNENSEKISSENMDQEKIVSSESPLKSSEIKPKRSIFDFSKAIAKINPEISSSPLALYKSKSATLDDITPLKPETKQGRLIDEIVEKITHQETEDEDKNIFDSKQNSEKKIERKDNRAKTQVANNKIELEVLRIPAQRDEIVEVEMNQEETLETRKSSARKTRANNSIKTDENISIEQSTSQKEKKQELSLAQTNACILLKEAISSALRRIYRDGLLSIHNSFTPETIDPKQNFFSFRSPDADEQITESNLKYQSSNEYVDTVRDLKSPPKQTDEKSKHENNAGKKFGMTRPKINTKPVEDNFCLDDVESINSILLQSNEAGMFKNNIPKGTSLNSLNKSKGNQKKLNENKILSIIKLEEIVKMVQRRNKIYGLARLADNHAEYSEFHSSDFDKLKSHDSPLIRLSRRNYFFLGEDVISQDSRPSETLRSRKPKKSFTEQLDYSKESELSSRNKISKKGSLPASGERSPIQNKLIEFHEDFISEMKKSRRTPTPTRSQVNSKSQQISPKNLDQIKEEPVFSYNNLPNELSGEINNSTLSLTSAKIEKHQGTSYDNSYSVHRQVTPLRSKLPSKDDVSSKDDDDYSMINMKNFKTLKMSLKIEKIVRLFQVKYIRFFMDILKANHEKANLMSEIHINHLQTSQELSQISKDHSMPFVINKRHPNHIMAATSTIQKFFNKVVSKAFIKLLIYSVKRREEEIVFAKSQFELINKEKNVSKLVSILTSKRRNLVSSCFNNLMLNSVIAKTKFFALSKALQIFNRLFENCISNSFYQIKLVSQKMDFNKSKRDMLLYNILYKKSLQNILAISRYYSKWKAILTIKQATNLKHKTTLANVKQLYKIIQNKFHLQKYSAFIKMKLVMKKQNDVKLFVKIIHGLLQKRQRDHYNHLKFTIFTSKTQAEKSKLINSFFSKLQSKQEKLLHEFFNLAKIHILSQKRAINTKAVHHLISTIHKMQKNSISDALKLISLTSITRTHRKKLYINFALKTALWITNIRKNNKKESFNAIFVNSESFVEKKRALEKLLFSKHYKTLSHYLHEFRKATIEINFNQSLVDSAVKNLKFVFEKMEKKFLELKHIGFRKIMFFAEKPQTLMTLKNISNFEPRTPVSRIEANTIFHLPLSAVTLSALTDKSKSTTKREANSMEFIQSIFNIIQKASDRFAFKTISNEYKAFKSDQIKKVEFLVGTVWDQVIFKRKLLVFEQLKQLVTDHEESNVKKIEASIKISAKLSRALRMSYKTGFNNIKRFDDFRNGWKAFKKNQYDRFIRTLFYNFKFGISKSKIEKKKFVKGVKNLALLFKKLQLNLASESLSNLRNFVLLEKISNITPTSDDTRKNQSLDKSSFSMMDRSGISTPISNFTPRKSNANNFSKAAEDQSKDSILGDPSMGYSPINAKNLKNPSQFARADSKKVDEKSNSPKVVKNTKNTTTNEKKVSIDLGKELSNQAEPVPKLKLELVSSTPKRSSELNNSFNKTAPSSPSGSTKNSKVKTPSSFGNAKPPLSKTSSSTSLKK